MKLKVAISLVALLFITGTAFSHVGDTIRITSTLVNVNALKKGTHQYLVYFKAGDDSSRVNYQLWTRRVDFVSFKGNPAVEVTQVWEDNSSVVHTVKSYSDQKTFAPLYHEVWWKNMARLKGETRFDYTAKSAFRNGVELSPTDTTAQLRKMYQAFIKSTEEYVLNWHLDLEVFPILPYKPNAVFLINFYDPGFGPPSIQDYAVKGSEVLTGYDNQKVDCWILVHESKFGSDKFWISKKTKEVLKLEQSIVGGKYKYRYKVKLGFQAP